MRFTKPAIASLKLPPRKGELIVFDDALPGFGIRLRGGGKRTWIVQYRIGKRQRRLTLGRADVLDLDRARTEARKALAKAGLAIDPQIEKERARAEEALAMGPLFDRYLRVKESQLRPNSLREIRRYLGVSWSQFLRTPISQINRAEIASRLGTLATESGGVTADRARAALSAFFTWAMREGLVGANPVIATNRHAVTRSRDRILSDVELGGIWSACRHDDFGRIVRLLILTGQRREEVAGIRWSEVDLKKGWWSLPASRTKNRRPHEVPLSQPALGVFQELLIRRDRDLVFGGSDRPFSGWSKAKASLEQRLVARRKAADGTKSTGTAAKARWTLHDLRRTVATGMAELGVGPHVIEAVLNHVSGARSGIAGIYNRALYSAEKRAALALWGDHVEALVAEHSAKVVSIRRGRSTT